ncbi:MAG: hypothetical protein H7338_15780 [Candidatus Sericytochromatia bacterium]|nr:hypothetical protein [Candidatus Sericytochromatia bacterium]
MAIARTAFLIGSLAVAAQLAGCSAVAGAPVATTPSASPWPAEYSACESPTFVQNIPADPWLISDFEGTVTDEAGRPLDGVIVSVRIVDSGNLAALRKAIPPDVIGVRIRDGKPECVQTHWQEMGDFTKFANGSDGATTVSKVGAWTIAHVPANATILAQWEHPGYQAETRTVTMVQNPSHKYGPNRAYVTLTAKS